MFVRMYDFTILFVIIIAYVEVTHSYLNYSLESPHLCSLNSKRHITLTSEQKSGLIVTQKRLNNHNLEWVLNSICKFQVTVKESRLNNNNPRGIIAVIQKISFRKNDETGECIDYVQFTSHDGRTNKKFCGSSTASVAMQPNSLDEIYDGSLAENTFMDPKGKIDVYIFVAKEPLLSHENSDISIVFTAYQECNPQKSTISACDSNMDVCIYSGFFKDGYYNCPYINCIDEDGCSSFEEDTIVTKDHIGNKVLIGSVTSLLVTFSIFICCIYVCRKYGKLCWAEEFARPSIVTILTEVDTENDINLPRTTGQVPVTPSAPVDDKDLPPSYDSLFPNTQLDSSNSRQ